MNFHDALENISTDIHAATGIRQTLSMNITPVMFSVLRLLTSYSYKYTERNVFYTKGGKLIATPHSGLQITLDGKLHSLAGLPMEVVKKFFSGEIKGSLFRTNGKLFATRQHIKHSLTLEPSKHYIMMAVIYCMFRTVLEEGNDIIVYPSRYTAIEDILNFEAHSDKKIARLIDDLIVAIDPLVIKAVTTVAENPEYMETVYNIDITRDGGRIKLDRLGSVYEFKLLESQKERDGFG